MLARFLPFLALSAFVVAGRASTGVPDIVIDSAVAMDKYQVVPWTLHKTGVYNAGTPAGTGTVTWTVAIGRGTPQSHVAVAGYIDIQSFRATPAQLTSVVVNLQQASGLGWATTSSDIADAATGDAATLATVDQNVTAEYQSVYQENAMSGTLLFQDSVGAPLTLNGPGVYLPGAGQTTRVYFVAQFGGTLADLAPGTALNIEVITTFDNITSLSTLGLPATVPQPVVANGSANLLDPTITASGTVITGPFTGLNEVITQSGSYPLSVSVDGAASGGTVCNTATLTSPSTTIPFVTGGISVPLLVVPGVNLSANDCQPVPPRDTPHPITPTINSCAQVVTYDASLFTSPNGTIVSATFTPASGSTFPFGTSAVNYIVTDSDGITGTGTLTVNVIDSVPPVITPIANIVAPADLGACGTHVTFGTTATDCNPVTISYSPASGAWFPVGVTTVTITATDPAGHASTSTFTVTVNDTQLPNIISPLTDLLIQPDSGDCTALFTYTPAAVDNCTGGVTVTVSPASGSRFAAGTSTVVTVTATDSSGNVTVGTFTVVVGQCLPPGLKLTKTASPTIVAPFQPVTYTYTVTNTGGATLTNIVIKDDNGTPDYAADDFVVGTIASLAPGASATLTVTVIPVVSTVAVVNGSTVPAGTIIISALPNGDIRATYLQSFSVNDNTYGTGQIGWPGGNHTFSHLLKSDQVEFRFVNGNGAVVMDFRLDYLNATSSVTIPGTGQVISYPSGYGTSGPFGGDGAMVTGNANNIVTFSTSLTDSLNAAGNLPYKASLMVNSPTSLVSGNVVVDPTKAPAGWNYLNSYTVVLKGSAFGSSGFGSLSIPSQHNSPSKLGVEQICPKPTNSTVTNTATATTGNLTATATATVTIGTPPPPAATGSIGSLVWSDNDGDGLQDAGEPGIPGLTVTLKNSSGTVIATDVTDGDGVYQFDGLTAGTYTVVVATPTGYTASPKLVGTDRTIDSNGSPATVTLATNSSVDLTIDFGFKPNTTCSKPLLTYTQGGWGAQPKGNNPGALLTKYFSSVYPGGYVGIGTSSRYLVFTSASAVIKFLPQGSTPGVLTGSAFNPTTSSAGVFAGQLLALRLNVDFSNAGRTATGLAGKKIVSGPLAGKSVNDVLNLANSVIAGGALPSGLTLSGLNDVLTAINENYDNGTTNNGYLN